MIKRGFTLWRTTNVGFTLIELLLSVGLIAVIAGISIPVWLGVQTKNDLDIAAVTVAQSWRRSQTLSQSNDGDTTWGVKLQSGSATIFKGASYAARDTNYDEVADVPTTISFSGPTEEIFAKLTGFPQTTGTLTISSSANSSTKSLVINSKGSVSY